MGRVDVKLSVIDELHEASPSFRLIVSVAGTIEKSGQQDRSIRSGIDLEMIEWPLVAGIAGPPIPVDGLEYRLRWRRNPGANAVEEDNGFELRKGVCLEPL